MTLYPIVEGHGEVAAAPILLRRLIAAAERFDFQVGTPIRRSQSQFRNQGNLQAAVRLALLQPDCAGILILCDGEDECPLSLAGAMQLWAREAAGETPCEIVIAYREYETWFLAALESLRGLFGISADAKAPGNPEGRRDAKGWLEEFMPRSRAYSETGDQPGMSAVFDLAAAYRGNRSFRRLVHAVGALLAGTGRLPDWPPQKWLESP